MSETFFQPAKGILDGMLFCEATNRLAFEDQKAADAYIERFCPGTHVEEVWTCATCKKTHFRGYPQSPAGETSGSGRHDTMAIPLEIQASLLKNAPKYRTRHP